MRAPVVLLSLAVLAAACSSDGGGRKAAPSASASAAAAAPVLVAAARQDASIEIFAIGADRVARKVGTVPAPVGTNAVQDLALSAGARPALCARWGVSSGDNDDRGVSTDEQVRCHAFGDRVGTPVPELVGLWGYSLRPDGAALAWVHPVGPSDDQELVLADLNARTARVTRRLPTYRDDAPVPSTGCDSNLVGVTWMDEGHLLLDCGGSDDRPGIPAVLPLTAGGRGVPVPVPQAEYDKGYSDLIARTSATSTAALAVEVELCDFECEGGRRPRPSRAVRVGLPSGEIVEVIATAATGRYLNQVSGGARGVLYVTEVDPVLVGGGNVDVRLYLRLPGEKHGVAVTGLPSDVNEVVAQQ